MHDAAGLQRLIAEYGKLGRLDGHTPQSRGRRFNEVIAGMLRCWGIEAQVSVRSAGEIDVAFTADGVRYLLEAKWEQVKADTGDIAKLQRRVRQRLAGTVGVFVAMAGYSPDALSEVALGERLEVLLLDRRHFEAMLSGFSPPQELLNLMHDRAAFRGEAYTPLYTLLTTHDAPPAALFDPASELAESLVHSTRDGVSCSLLCTLPDSGQLGIAVRNKSHLLVTTQDGIIEVDLNKKQSSWAVPIPNCHRNPIAQRDGSILFMRRHGVGHFRAGELSIAGGGFAGGSCLVKSLDGAAWVMSNGDLSGNPGPSITCLGDGFGDEIRHSLVYPPASAFNAIWADENNLVTVGNSGFLITNLASGVTRTVNAAQSNPMGAINFSDNVVLTVGNSVCVGLTDLATGKYAEVAHLALRPSVNEIAAGPDNHFYLASYYGDGHMPIAVVDVSIDVPIDDFVPATMAEANRDDLSAYAAEVDRIRADTTPVKRETEQEHLERLYNETVHHVNRALLLPLQRAVESVGLRQRIFEERSLDG